MTILLTLYIVIGVVIGLIMGALPGLTVTMTAVLVVSLTFGWNMMEALAFIIGAFCGGVMGGSITAITLNIPGTAAAVATVFDGNKMKLKGEADNALSIALFVSFFRWHFWPGVFGIFGSVIRRGCSKIRFSRIFLNCRMGNNPCCGSEQREFY